MTQAEPEMLDFDEYDGRVRMPCAININIFIFHNNDDEDVLLMPTMMLLMMVVCLCRVFEQVRVPSHARYC